MERYDLVILGSGSTAFAAALRAAELGHTAVMTESRTLGGTCVNRGCLPSKNLIEAARIYWEAQHPRYSGLQPGGKAAMALRFGASVYDFIDMVHVYPTMAEALKIAAVSFFKDVERLSCCAE